MHEQAIIDKILEHISDKTNVLKIELEVGELAGIEPEHLKEHLGERVNWEININSKKSQVKCSCGYEGYARIKQRLHDMVIYDCPRCENVPEVLEGKDIKIVKVIYK